MVTFLCHHTQHDFFLTFMFAICHMGVIRTVRNTTAVDELQVAITYAFDLAVRNVRGQIASNFFKGVLMFKPKYF